MLDSVILFQALYKCYIPVSSPAKEQCTPSWIHFLFQPSSNSTRILFKLTNPEKTQLLSRDIVKVSTSLIYLLPVLKNWALMFGRVWIKLAVLAPPITVVKLVWVWIFNRLSAETADLISFLLRICSKICSILSSHIHHQTIQHFIGRNKCNYLTCKVTLEYYRWHQNITEYYSFWEQSAATDFLPN